MAQTIKNWTILVLAFLVLVLWAFIHETRVPVGLPPVQDLDPEVYAISRECLQEAGIVQGEHYTTRQKYRQLGECMLNRIVGK